MSRYRKLLVALAGALINIAAAVFDVVAPDYEPIVVAVIAALTAAGVYQVPNEG